MYSCGVSYAYQYFTLSDAILKSILKGPLNHCPLEFGDKHCMSTDVLSNDTSLFDEFSEDNNYRSASADFKYDKTSWKTKCVILVFIVKN